MNIRSFVVKNALRNKRRMLLTVLSVAMSTWLLITLLVALRELSHPPIGAGASLRIAVPSKVSLARALPAHQKRLIERMPGVVAITPLTWFGGRVNDQESFNLPQFGIDPATFLTIFSEATLDPVDYNTWVKQPTSCIVGREVADRYGIKVGDRLRIQGDIYPVNLELDVAGIYLISGASAADSIFFHHAYLDQALGDPGTVGMWWVQAASPEVVPDLIDRINAAFANTADEVRAETERAFQMGFLSMLGNIGILIGAICSAVVFTLALVSASTMSMAIRERFRELSVLKALGFRRRDLFGFILAESFGLSVAGAVIGGGIAAALYSSDMVTKVTRGFFPVFQVTPAILATAFTIAAILGILASIAPSLAIARLSVVDGLRALD